jgi:type I restriction enzyme S subunit
MRDGWTETTLGDVADVIDPHPSHRAPPEHDGGVPFIGIGDVRDGGRTDFGRARKVSPSVLVEHALRYDRKQNLIGLGRVASIGLVVRLPTGGIDYAVSPTLAVLHPREMDNDFLFYYLQADSLQEQLQTYKRGSTRQSVGMLTLRQLKVFVPPLVEQKRIVDVVSSVDAYIDALQQQADSTRRARSAVLHELLSARGDDWSETTVGGIAEVVGGGTPSTTNPTFWGGEVIWLTPSEVSSMDGKVIKDSIRKISDAGLRGSGARLLPVGTVILTSRASVGFVALAGVELTTNQGFQSLIPSKSVLSRFLMFWIQQNRYEFESRSAGSTFKEISKSNVKSIPLDLPPLAEQRRIVGIVSSMDDVIQSTEKAVVDAKSMRSGLLSDLLSGEREIPASYDSLLGAA